MHTFASNRDGAWTTWHRELSLILVLSRHSTADCPAVLLFRQSVLELDVRSVVQLDLVDIRIADL